VGGFEIFRLTAINQVGGFDVKIKGAAEDGDIAMRIRNAGWDAIQK
jgi:GT2 family glycosyltransferase